MEQGLSDDIKDLRNGGGDYDSDSNSGFSPYSSPKGKRHKSQDDLTDNEEAEVDNVEKSI